MNSHRAFELLFSQATIERLGWVLVHSLWQFAVVALIAGVTVRALRWRSAELRYSVLVVALGGASMAPVVTWILLPGGETKDLLSLAASPFDSEWEPATNRPADAGPLAGLPDAMGVPGLDPNRDLTAAEAVSERRPVASPPLADSPAALTLSERAVALLRPWLPWIVAGWGMGVAFCSLRPLLGWRTLWRLQRVGISPVSDEVLSALRRVSARLGIRHAVHIAQSTLAQVPVVVGYFRPIVLLPVSLLADLPVAQLEAILAHELAHVRRHDFVVNLLQALVETVFFYHPAVWWISHRIRVEREHCCDDLVVMRFGNPVDYGRALVAIEELHGRGVLLAPGAADGSLLSRVRRIAGAGNDRAARSPWSVANLVACCTGAILGLGVLGWYGMAETHEIPGKNATESQSTLSTEVSEQAEGENGAADPPDIAARLNDAHQEAAHAPQPAHPLVARLPGDIRLELCGVMELGLGQRLELVQWSHDSKQLAATGTFNKLVLWGRQQKGWSPAALDADHHANSIAVSRKSPLLVIGTNVGTAEVWNAATRKRVCELRSSPSYSVYAVAISRDDKLVAACGTDGTVHVFDRESQERVVVLGEKAATHMASLAFAPDGKTLAAMDRYGNLVLWSLPGGARLAEWKNVAGEDCAVQWSPDGRQLAVSGWGRVTLIAAERGSQPQIVMAPEAVLSRYPHDRNPRSSGPEAGGIKFASVTAIAPDLRTVASVAPDASIGVWDLATRKIVQKLPAPAKVAIMDSQSAGLRNLVFSPDGQRLACTNLNGEVVFWRETMMNDSWGADELNDNEDTAAEDSADPQNPGGEDKRPPDDRGQPGPEPDTAVETDPFQREVSLSANELPLKDAVRKLAAWAKLEVEFDTAALKETGLDLEQSVSVNIENLPLGKALGLLAPWESHPQILREVHRGTLLFTTLEAWQKRTVARLPKWMQPLYNHGLLATVDDDDQVETVTTSGIMTDELLEKFKSLPKLTELHIEVTKEVTAAGLAHLAGLRSLKKLTLFEVNQNGDGLGDDAIRALAGLAALRELSITECGTTDQGAKLLEKLPQLTALNLRQEGFLTDSALASIGKLKNLRSLSLPSYVGTERFGWMKFSADGIRQLAGLKELESLELVGHEVPAEALVFPKLKSLSLGSLDVDDRAAARIAQLRELTRVELTFCDITDVGLAQIATLPKLRRLDISSRVITDAGIKAFRKHLQLEHLSLRATLLSDEALEHIAQIPTLTRIDLHGSGLPGVTPGGLFSIDGLLQLKALLRLETLWLTNFDIPGGGYAALKELKHLRTLHFMFCNVGDAELDALEEALPDASITSASGGKGRMPKKLREAERKTPARAPKDDRPGD